MRVFKDDHQGTYKLVCQYLFQLAWYRSDHRLKLTFTIKISKRRLIRMENQEILSTPHQKCQCKAMSVFNDALQGLKLVCRQKNIKVFFLILIYLTAIYIYLGNKISLFLETLVHKFIFYQLNFLFIFSINCNSV